MIMRPFRSTQLLLLLILLTITTGLVECFAPPAVSTTALLRQASSSSSICSSARLSSSARSPPCTLLSTRATATTTPSSLLLMAHGSSSNKGIELANLLYDSTSTAFDAWEWTAGLGAPAALVAGAVLVTLSETRQDLAPRGKDPNWVRVMKLTTRFLLFSSFALEVASIFVSTVTGTVLLSHGELAAAKSAANAVGYTAPLELLHYHHEFEYLTIQIGFLQGLLHWLGAVALEFVVPRVDESVSNLQIDA